MSQARRGPVSSDRARRTDPTGQPDGFRRSPARDLPPRWAIRSQRSLRAATGVGLLGTVSTRAGTPATVVRAETSRVTTAPAPMSARAPMRMPPSTTAPEPMDAPRSTTVPVASSLPPTGGTRSQRRTWSLVVHEHHPVADEDLVLDRGTVADERMALDLATGADSRAALDLDEWADTGFVTDRAAVEVRERENRHPLAERNILDHAKRRIVRGPSATVEPGCHRVHDVQPCDSVIPGKIGSERHSRPIASATGKVPALYPSDA